MRRPTYCLTCGKRGPDTDGLRCWAQCPRCRQIREFVVKETAIAV